MGGIFWDEWARLMCLTASFIIFVGGIMGAFQPLPAFDAMWKLPQLYSAPLPVLPAILTVLGLIIAAVEYPLVSKDYFSSSNSIMPRIAFYIPFCVLALLEAQTVNGGAYLAIGIIAYLMAIRAEFQKQQTSSSGRMA